MSVLIDLESLDSSCTEVRDIAYVQSLSVHSKSLCGIFRLWWACSKYGQTSKSLRWKASTANFAILTWISWHFHLSWTSDTLLQKGSNPRRRCVGSVWTEGTVRMACIMWYDVIQLNNVVCILCNYLWIYSDGCYDYDGGVFVSCLIDDLTLSSILFCLVGELRVVGMVWTPMPSKTSLVSQCLQTIECRNY